MTPPLGAALGLAAAAVLAVGWCSAAPGRRIHGRLRGLGEPAVPAPGQLGPSAAAPPLPAPTTAAAVGIGATVLVTTMGPGATTALVLATAGVALLLRRQHRAERRQLRRRQLPDALDRLAAALRAGSSLPVALAEVGGHLPAPLGLELAALGREAAGGRPLVDVLDDWTTAHDDTGTRLAATAMVLATTVGAAPGRALDGVASTLRERLQLADERRALATQARSSAVVLSVAPLGFGLLLGVADGPAGEFLLGTPAGGACLVAGVALDIAGGWWMARLTRGHEA